MLSSNNTSSRKSTNSEIKYRQKALGDIIEDAKKRNDIINENYLLYHMQMRGIEDYTRSKLYHDKLDLDLQNNYIRHFLPRYSRYQQEINDELDKIHDDAVALGQMDFKIVKTHRKQTKNGTFVTTIEENGNWKLKTESLRIRTKVAELKMKHGEGQNIQVGAYMLQKDLQKKKDEIARLAEENHDLKITNAKSLPSSSD